MEVLAPVDGVPPVVGPAHQVTVVLDGDVEALDGIVLSLDHEAADCGLGKDGGNGGNGGDGELQLDDLCLEMDRGDVVSV